MKSFFPSRSHVCSVLVLWQSVAYADLPEPKGKTENPNVVAARKAIDAKDYKGRSGPLDQSGAGIAQRRRRRKHARLQPTASLGHSTNPWSIISARSSSTPNHRYAHEYLGELYLDMNQPDNAEKQLVALKKACPFLGKCEEYDDLKKAIDSYKAKKK